MRACVLLGICALFVFTLPVVIAQAQQDPPSAQTQNQDTTAQTQNQDTTAQTQDENTTVEGTVASTTHNVLVVRSDDDKYHVFTYDHNSIRAKSLAPGARVRVTAGAPDENGTRVVSDVTVLQAAPTGAAATPAAPLPPKVRQVESSISSEARRFHIGVHAGVAFDPELFLLGAQAEFGPIFHRRVVFRPGAEYGFGEVTNLVTVNFEVLYRFSTPYRRAWVPYIGAGPSLNFIDQDFNHTGVSFNNFDYKTGFNVLAGAQRRGTFVELKTSLWSSPAPVLRLIVGYNF